MKQGIIIAVLIVVALVIFGCTLPGINSFNLGENFTAKQGNVYYNSNEQLGVYLINVTDSRCPKDVQCIWAGELGASLLIVAKDSNQLINLGLTTQPSQVISNYSINLISVNSDTNEAVLKIELTKIDANVPDTNVPLVGGDKDAHGCIGSAGYSWCESKQKCLRVWEEACSETDNNTNAGLANPASTNCITKGGTLSIQDTNEGQIGLCTFPNGKECEEWALFRGDCNANACGPCPQYSPPAPGFCSDGKIVADVADECGCIGPPKCEPVACTMDAMACPDGSYVGRVAPDCNFSPCPGN